MPMKWEGDLAAICVTAGITVLTTIGAALLDVEESFWPWGITALSYFVAAIALGIRRSNYGWIGVVSMFGGIALGIVIHTVFTVTTSYPDSNLWPIAIVIYWIIGLFPIGIGYLIGWQIKRQKQPP